MPTCLLRRPRARQGNAAPRAPAGAALPKLAVLLSDPATVWTAGMLPWYAQGEYALEWCSGQALWYHGGKAPLPLRWVLSRDPARHHPARAFLQTELTPSAIPPLPVPLSGTPAPRTAVPPGPAAEAVPSAPLPLLGADAPAGRAVLLGYQGRWRLEVTLEESRAHLGVETQRQWSTKAIARSTPGLLGLFSLVVLSAQRLHPDGQIPVAQAAWYRKQQATFSDVLATVRHHVWRQELFDSPLQGGEQITLRYADLARVMQAAAA